MKSLGLSIFQLIRDDFGGFPLCGKQLTSFCLPKGAIWRYEKKFGLLLLICVSVQNKGHNIACD